MSQTQTVADLSDRIRRMLRAEPFEPFSITMADGRIFSVRSPDAVAMPSAELSPAEIFVATQDKSNFVNLADVVGAYPMEDVSSVALMEAHHRGFMRGFEKGNRIGGALGFILGLIVGVGLTFGLAMYFTIHTPR